MSDHIDGPRVIGDPVADVTDLFAFTSPGNPARTVVALDVFPGAGAQAIFSNAIAYSMAIRRVTVTGTGNAAGFAPTGDEIRFTCEFANLVPEAKGGPGAQRGTCTLPDGRKLDLVVNDEQGASTGDGTFRVFAGLRSDPFYLAWDIGNMRRMPNLLEHDNVLCIVVEFDTRSVLAPEKGSLFGIVGETVPIPRPGLPVGGEPPRIDWVGRPEQTNVRLNNVKVPHYVDIRDLWNQQTPFAIDPALKPMFRQHLAASFENYDLRDGKADWTPEALAANVNVFLDDFLVFDVAKPITDDSHLEIERSTVNGKAYTTGGGRTPDANSIDILLTWLVNRDREFLQGGAKGATKPGTKVFPYFAAPNTELQVVVDSIDLAAPPDKVWSVVGGFGGTWHPLIARITLTGAGVGQLRFIETIDGKHIVERLDAMDDANRFYRYTNIGGIPASNYTGEFAVKPKGTGSTVEWRAQFLANDQATFIVKLIVSTLFRVGLESLPPRFGALK